jgi:hypothetical protein
MQARTADEPHGTFLKLQSSFTEIFGDVRDTQTLEASGSGDESVTTVQVQDNLVTGTSH